jgi:hypothetical protein
MCFSATGSFAAAGVLAIVGSTALVRNASPRHRMFAAMPLLFAVQQAAEGVVWLSMHRPDQAWLQQAAVYVFLGFALLAWPLWAPWSLLQAEQGADRRRILLGLCAAGAGVAIYALLLLGRWRPVAEIAGHSIRYVYAPGPDSWPPGVYLAAYAIPTVLPFFISSARMARVLGVTLVVSLAAAIVIERDALTSVWCFFAAIISGLVLVAVLQERQFTATALARV